MGRPRRAADGGLVYHVLNRANARMTIFEKPEDYAAFLRILEEAVERTETRLLNGKGVTHNRPRVKAPIS